MSAATSCCQLPMLEGSEDPSLICCRVVFLFIISSQLGDLRRRRDDMNVVYVACVCECVCLTLRGQTAASSNAGAGVFER